ncbi:MULTISPECIES: DEAD/DEAH box helicase family protein [Campylobacter]|uniref:restriction endonuclease n=1 Tax=Campylobacter TaxID=194 RepID=UPI0023F44664|nr:MULTISPECIES: DEAD/DEAH box helicase family protein [Campylobacter]MCI6641060.1 DEAD/DEAH box helicase family protein [Campylobacter sp.]MDD7422363.1 DEAD/DEAH box helicase family protein [Campylobacter hominis]MDY3117552.1 DEAD/DEAH box helicase family protein [Campylobacter hominis]
MIFEEQDYQQVCIKNILEILENFDFETHSNLEDCLKKFYSNSDILIKKISKNRNLDILMETGTGKTFTYLNLIFELNKNFNQNKFIIFVPRKAILESVKQNINLTGNYFSTKFSGKFLHTYYYTDSKSSKSIIHGFLKNREELSVLVLTNSAIDKQDNILNKQNEGLFNAKSILENIIELNPICILDEPHLLKGEKFHQNFNKFNSLYFRFGATFPDKPTKLNDLDFSLCNVAYMLDSVSAFNNYLVKQIKVHTIVSKNYKPVLLEAKNKVAKISYFKDNIEQTGILKNGENLQTLDADLPNATISKITAKEIFLDNGTILKKSNLYELDKNEISQMLKIAIDLHFEKEIKLFKKNIKTLSLFFIPNISDFRGDNAYIKDEFQRLFKIKLNKILKENLDENYREFLNKSFDKNGELCVCEGYFSGDAKIKEKNKENQEAADIELILSKKDELLSFSTPLRFIFSVWALQEGWDNPNIFTITKLANSSSDTSRHQQVGRGLRICVNQNGNRLTYKFLNNDENEFFDLNYLDMIVSGNEKNFIEALQQEIVESSYTFGGDFLDEYILKNLGIPQNQISRFFTYLEDDEILKFDEMSNKYHIQTSIYDYLRENEKFKKIFGENYNSILENFKNNENKRAQIINANKQIRQVEIRQNLADKFRELWECIKSKAEISYKNIVEENIISNVVAKFNQIDVNNQNTQYLVKRYDSFTNRIIIEKTDILKTDYYEDINKDEIIKFCKNFVLPLDMVLKIFNLSDKKNFHINPKEAYEKLAKLIKEQIHQNLLSSVSYEFSKYEFSNDPLFNADKTPKSTIEAHKLGKNIKDDKSPARNFLFDTVVGDSAIEYEIMSENNEFLGTKKIEVFAKLPKFSIPTPYKSYEPDFAYLIDCGHDKKIFFVCETKGYDDFDDISAEERRKISYAKVFFKDLNETLKGKNIEVIFNTRINKENLITLLEQSIKGCIK